MFIRTLMCFAWLAAPAAALAQVTPAAAHVPPDDTQSVKFGVTIFYDFTAQTKPTKVDDNGNEFKPTSFNVSRTYVNFTGNISHNISFRITPDITTESGAGSSLNGSYTVRLKYGFAQFNLGDWTTPGSWIRLGLQQTPWVDYAEGVYRYRFQGTVFADREGYLTSSDKGASMKLNFKRNYGDVQFGIFNGDGYNHAEANGQKAFQIRATVRPLASGSPTARGLRVTGFYDADNYIKNGEKRRGIVNVTFEHTRFNFGAEYLAASDQKLGVGPVVKAHGYSVWITPFFQQKGNGWEAVLRYDSLKPDTDVDRLRKRAIAGLAYWFPHPGGNATAALLIDYDHQTFAGTTTNKIGVHGLINY